MVKGGPVVAILPSTPLESATEDDLRHHVEVARVREYVSLDYKAKAYPHSHAGAVEMLADITAMANSRGGLILIGVEEDSDAPDGTPKALLGISRADEEANWIQSLCQSSIDERIPGLKVREVPLSSGLHCLIVQVPNSPSKPHMVIHEKHRSFRFRHGRSNVFIGMQEVRAMVLDASAYRSALTAFTDERIARNRTEAQDSPFLLVSATPLYVGADRIDPLRSEFKSLLERVPGNPDARFDGILVGTPQPRVFGIESRPYGRGSDRRHLNFLRLFRNGHFEYFESLASFATEEWPAKAMPIHSYRIAVLLLHFLAVSKEIYDLAELADPMVLSIVLGNINPSYLHPWARPPAWLDDIFIWQSDLLQIDAMLTDFDNPPSHASRLLDRLFQAFGYEKNSHLDDNFSLIKPR